MTIPDVASLIVETGAKAEGAREEGLSVAVSTDRMLPLGGHSSVFARASALDPLVRPLCGVVCRPSGCPETKMWLQT